MFGSQGRGAASRLIKSQSEGASSLSTRNPLQKSVSDAGWQMTHAADGTLVEPADVDHMVGIFQSLLPGIDAGEARRRLAEHGWGLQAAIKEATLFGGVPLTAESERGLLSNRQIPRQTVSKDDGAVVGEDEAELVKLRLRLREIRSVDTGAVPGWDETEEIVRVRPDSVDLTAHTGLLELPAELRACAGCVRSLAVRSRDFEALPVWLGELTGLTELRVDGMKSYGALRELPDTVGQLTMLRKLELRGCPGVKELPDAVSQLTALRTLELQGCREMKALPQGLTTLTGLQDLLLTDCRGIKQAHLLDALGWHCCRGFRQVKKKSRILP
jgi:hypothetical protein